MDFLTKITGYVVAIAGAYLANDEIYNIGTYLAEHGASLIAH